MFDVKEKPKMVERAMLVGIQDYNKSSRETESLLDELGELVETLGIGVVAAEVVRLKNPQPKFLTGVGKTEQLIELARELECDCIVFDAELSPAQQRNWENASELCVIDRQEVILDIFGERAQTREATLQVELARAEYSLPRLKRAWLHLSRQRGGGVTQRGEGEAQIELDQRMLRQRISRLKEELSTVVRQRATQRKQRMRVPVPTASIIGYTNAGKSSLLNRMTGASVLEEDKLFATLDPTTRRLELPSGQTLLLTDTVGFVRRLPHRLVEAFKATLEETLHAEFLVHVVDVTSPEADEHIKTTLEVLKELGASDKPIITAYNKIDLLEEEEREHFQAFRGANVCYVSAVTGEGIDRLSQRMEAMLAEFVTPMELLIPHDRYDLINQLHRSGCVQDKDPREEGVYILANLPARMLEPYRPFAVAGIPEPKESPNNTASELQST